MAKLSMKLKQARTPKFSTRAYTRCRLCGRPHSVLRPFVRRNQPDRQLPAERIVTSETVGRNNHACGKFRRRLPGWERTEVVLQHQVAVFVVFGERHVALFRTGLIA